jgi:hypothetical protein
MGATSTASGDDVCCYLYPCRQSRILASEPVLLMALKIILHAKLCLSVIIFLICYLRVLASRKVMQGTAQVWAEGES